MKVKNDHRLNISIITPYFNCSNRIVQHFKDIHEKIKKNKSIELIYIDDGSREKLDSKFVKKLNKLERVSHYRLKKNYGPGIARNFGIKKAKGNFLLFLDSDDSLNKKNFFLLNKYIQKKHINDVIFFDFINKPFKKQFNLSIKKIKKNIILKKYLRTELDMNPNFYVYKKNFLINNKISFVQGFYEDIYFVLQVFTLMQNYDVFKKKVYVKFNSKNSITNSYSKKHVECFAKSSLQKLNYFKKKIFLNFKNISFDDFQYGLRGDFIFINNMLKKVNVSKSFKKKIFSIYSQIIHSKFLIKTAYDKKVFKILKKGEFIN